MKSIAAITFVLMMVCAGALYAQNASSENFQIKSPALVETSGQSSSDSFGLKSCLSLSPAGGVSSSDSFIMRSGCGILFLQKAPAGETQPTGQAGEIDPPAEKETDGAPEE